jgi:hypothetical protein
MKESVRLTESLNGQLDATFPDEQEVHLKLLELAGKPSRVHKENNLDRYFDVDEH